MSYPQSAQRNRVLVLAATAAVFFFGMMAEATAQTATSTTPQPPACPEGYTQTSKGCLQMRGRPRPRVDRPPPQYQQQQQKKIVQPQPQQCTGAYEVRQGRQCVCVRGYTRKGGACVSAQVAQPQCGAYEVRRGNRCECAQGYIRQGGACVLKVACKGPYEIPVGNSCGCQSGYDRKDGRCVPKVAECKGPYEVPLGSRKGACGCQQGYDRKDGRCVPKVAACKGPYEVPLSSGSGCGCQQGYDRKDGRCVPKVAECKGPYEVPLGSRKGACGCQQGYDRKDGRCVPKLAECKGPYEVPLSSGRGCGCQPGYDRSDGRCVPRKVAEPQYCKGPYEVRYGKLCGCEPGYFRRDGACVRRGQVVVIPPPIVPPQFIPPGPGREPPPSPPPGPAFVPPPPPQAGPQEFVPGHVLVGFESAGDLEKVVREIEAAQRAGGITVRGARSASLQVDRIGATSIRLRLDFRRGGTRLAGAAELEALREYARYLSRETDAAFAHPNWMLDLEGPRTLHLEDLAPEASIQSTGNASTNISLPSDLSDPTLRSGLLWDFLPPPIGMNAFAAWSTTKGSRDVVVAVIDTGILPDHPAIRGSQNVLPGYNFITDPEAKGSNKDGPEPSAVDNGDGCSEILGSSWHGTHVAGTIGAGRTNNGLGVSGVNWAVSVLPIRAMGRCGGRGNVADLASAINWAAGLDVPGVPKNERKADVINLSVSLRKTCDPDEVGVLKQALEDARKAGVVVVAAAGNRKPDAQPVDIKGVTPAGCSGVISVAASDRRGHLAHYSNYGKVSVMAPGGDLDQDDDNDSRPDGIWSFVAPSTEYPSGVAAKEGTSMAAPHVSAAIALALSAKSELRGKPAEIEKLLKRSLAPKPADACSRQCGPGLLDAKAMVEPETVTSSTSRSVSPKRVRATQER